MQSYVEPTRKDVQKYLSEMYYDLQYTLNGTNYEYFELLETLEYTRERLHRLARIQYYNYYDHAHRVKYFTLTYIYTDYYLACNDVKHSMISNLISQKQELVDIINTLSSKGVDCTAYKQMLSELYMTAGYSHVNVVQKVVVLNEYQAYILPSVDSEIIPPLKSEY